MHIDLNVLIPILVGSVVVVGWLIFRNRKDEEDFENSLDQKEERPTEEHIKNSHFER